MGKYLILFHLIATAFPIIAVYYDVEYLGWKVFDLNEKMRNNKPYMVPLKGRIMFLTIWNLVSSKLLRNSMKLHLSK